MMLENALDFDREKGGEAAAKALDIGGAALRRLSCWWCAVRTSEVFDVVVVVLPVSLPPVSSWKEGHSNRVMYRSA